MKYKMNNNFAYVLAVGFLIIWLLYFLFIELRIRVTVYPILIVIWINVLFSVVGIFRSYIILEPEKIIIYAGLMRKTILFENVECIKETGSILAFGTTMSYGYNNLGIKVKGWIVAHYILVSVQNLDDFLNDIGILQPDIKIYRKYD